jgi:5-deoxy-D-glucuronate isomerase
VKKVNQDVMENRLEKEYSHHLNPNLFKVHQVYQVHQVHLDKKAIWVHLDIMIILKSDHPDKM